MLLIAGFLAASGGAANNGPENLPFQVDLVGHPGSVQFGYNAKVLPNGNIVVVDPFYSMDSKYAVGGVYLYDGASLKLISALTGSTAEDKIGIGAENTYPVDGIIVLPSGNFLVRSPYWHNGWAANVGAVTWCSGTTGCPGVVSAANSLVGTQPYDLVGAYRDDYIKILPSGDYVVNSPYWDNEIAEDAGAATWCSGTTGCQGNVSSANSLVGTQGQDSVGAFGVKVLPNGNYLVVSPYWGRDAMSIGALTWCSGTSGCSGPVTPSNSLVGTQGEYNYLGAVNPNIQIFANGNYMMLNPSWDNGTVIDVGVVTWCDGTIGCTGVVTTTNSLLGSTTGDRIGNGYVTELPTGAYLVHSSGWDDGTMEDVGAVTWCSGTSGCVGVVTPANSLVGTHPNDRVGGARVLANDNYVVLSPEWDNGTTVDVGAVTWCNGAIGCTGVVSVTNSLVGSHPGDSVGLNALALGNGNYVVSSPKWDNGWIVDVGAATWCNGTTGCTGAVTTANSLVGTQTDDLVGQCGLGTYDQSPFPPPDNHYYVICSAFWDNGAVKDIGAITWCNETSGCAGTISEANSLVGNQTADMLYSKVVWLANGNYVVKNELWDNGSVTDAGIVTWCSGKTGCTGVITPVNSLVGTIAAEQVGWQVSPLPSGNYVVKKGTTWDSVPSVIWCNGMSGCVGTASAANGLMGTRVEVLSNGNYVVANPYWSNNNVPDLGSLTWCNERSGCPDAANPQNSLVGNQSGDIPAWVEFSPAEDGFTIIRNIYWDNGTSVDAGAVTWCNEWTGCTGFISKQNSVLGEAPSGGYRMKFDYDSGRLAVGRPADNKVTVVFLGFKVYIPLLVK
jgi:hypothetical protein